MMFQSHRNFLLGMAFGVFMIFIVMNVRKTEKTNDIISNDLNGKVQKEETNVPSLQKLVNLISGWNKPEVKETRAKEKHRCNVTDLVSWDQFFSYGAQEKEPCTNMTEFGGQKVNQGKRDSDGVKLVCLDDSYKIHRNNCTVLSFGIAGDWSFDDEMDKFGCKVYSFDPTIGQKDHQRSPNVRFFNLGLSNVQGVVDIANIKCKVDRYENIIKMLNLTNTPIDYLKIDIETSELQFFEDVFAHSTELLKQVKQIGMEIHPGNANPSNPPENGLFNTFWKHMNRLECFGFRLMSYELNPVASNHYIFKRRVESGCYELVWGRIPN